MSEFEVCAVPGISLVFTFTLNIYKQDNIITRIMISFFFFYMVEIEFAAIMHFAKSIYVASYQNFFFLIHQTVISTLFSSISVGSVGLCSQNRVLCFRASPLKLEYYAQNYARLKV